MGPRILELESTFSGLMILGFDPSGMKKSQGWEPERGTSQDHRPCPQNSGAAAEVDVAMDGFPNKGAGK